MILGKEKFQTNRLNPTTFWDVDVDLLDVEKNKNFIIVRVLERGTDPEIWYIESGYSQQEIIAALKNTKGACKKTLNFYKTITI